MLLVLGACKVTDTYAEAGRVTRGFFAGESVITGSVVVEALL